MKRPRALRTHGVKSSIHGSDDPITNGKKVRIIDEHLDDYVAEVKDIRIEGEQ
jgi:hypothetical protein